MSVLTPLPQGKQRERGSGDRLPRASKTRARSAEIGIGLLGALALFVLVTGVPAALVIFVGYPLPRSAPSRDWLTVAISATLLIKILACVVWLVWAHFVVCLIAEWRALRRGRLPRNVPFGGGSQVLARRLVAAALLLSGAATAIPHAIPRVAHVGPPAPRRVAVAAQRPGVAHGASAAEAAPHGARHSREATAGKPGKYYVVAPPHGRRYDCLWDIAERTLGDPLRYKEIFALNRDRIQADGRKLVDANLILPGWQLWLPADASGSGVYALAASVPAAEAPDRGTDAARSPETTTGHVAHAPLGVGAPADTPAHAPAHASADATTVGDSRVGEIALGGGLMLAGLLMALRARRGPYTEPDECEQALARAADPGLAASLDRALRTLAAERRDQQQPLPSPIVAWAHDKTAVLSLAAGSNVADPPLPWSVDQQGRTWTCRLADVPHHSRAAEMAAPYPGLLAVGRHEGWELFVDFEQAPGIVSISGDPGVARQVVTALAVQAAISPWSDGAKVVLVGFGDGAQLASLDYRRIQHVHRLDAVLGRLAGEQAEFDRARRELGVDGVLTGRQARRDPTWQPTFVLLSGPPSADDERRLTQLVGTGRSNIVVLALGEVSTARWRFAVTADGRLDLGVLGTNAQAHRIGHVAAAELAALFADAKRAKRERGKAMAAMTPGAAAAASTSRAPARVRPAAPTVAAVSLLGPVTVTGPGMIEPTRVPLCTELAVAVALHPGGLHDAVLRASIWPRGVSNEVCAAALADVQQWLGRDSAGQPNLRCVDGRWQLGDGVTIDVAELRRLGATSSGTAGELEALLHAVGLFRGEAFSGTPSGRYSWLAFARAAAEARTLATALTRRASQLLVQRGDESRAEDVLRRGLALVPEAEPLWRELLMLCRRGGPGPAAKAVEEMYRTLHALSVWPDPETDALAAQLVPGRGVPRTA